MGRGSSALLTMKGGASSVELYGMGNNAAKLGNVIDADGNTCTVVEGKNGHRLARPFQVAMGETVSPGRLRQLDEAVAKRCKALRLKKKYGAADDLERKLHNVRRDQALGKPVDTSWVRQHGLLA